MSVDAFESAVFRGDAAEVAEHLEFGADPNGLVGPLTVLMAAAEFPRVEVVNEYRLTPEEWARKCGKERAEAGLVSRST